jgi:predicted amidohydrolase
MSPRRDGPRPAVIATCTFRQLGAESPDDLTARHLALIDRMAEQAQGGGLTLDLAILPECSFQFVKKSVTEIAEDLDGPTVTAIAEKARQLGAYATAPVPLRRDGRVFNCVVLLDRRGEVVGVYDKAFPVMMKDGSLEYGITPGSSFPVWDLDFGRVGIQICWDVGFEDGWQALADQDAELVIFCTNPASPVALRGRAWRHGYYIAASTTHPPGVIVNPVGQIIATTTDDGQVLVERIDLDYRVLHSNCLWEWPEGRRKEYAGRVDVAWDVDAHEYLVVSHDPELPVRRFLEIEGLPTGRQRNRRNARLQLEARGGPPTMPEPLERD